MLNSHTLVDGHKYEHIQYELRPVKDPAGNSVNGLHSAWIILDNPKQFNSYTTDAVKDVILALTRRSAPAGIPRSMPSTTPATRRSTSSTCACSTT
jgi:6-oxo-cyclohex-1-ene-carbonyl-CoA hydrolase